MLPGNLYQDLADAAVFAADGAVPFEQDLPRGNGNDPRLYHALDRGLMGHR